MSRRSAVTRSNRRRQHLKEWYLQQTGGRSVGNIGGQVVEKLTLEATDGEGHCHLARYAKNRDGFWYLLRFDEKLWFLKFCGKPFDARAALRKRGFTHRWLGLAPRRRDAQAASSRVPKGMGTQAGGTPYKGQRATYNPSSPGGGEGKDTAAERGISIVTDECSTTARPVSSPGKPAMEENPPAVIVSAVPTTGSAP
jgi:hypothetical protein